MKTGRASCAVLLGLIVGLAACGDDGGGAADASPPSDGEPSVDSGPTSGACGVQVFPARFRTAASSTVGLIVSFNRADGTLIGTAFTDVDGMASRDDCEPDTILTVGWIWENNKINAGPSEPPPTSLFSVYGVQPGDTVVVGRPAPVYKPSTVQLTTASNTSSNVAYEVHTGCLEFTGVVLGETMQDDFDSGCTGLDGTTIDAIGLARDTTSAPPHVIVGTAQAIGIPFVENGITTGALGEWSTLTVPPSVAAQVTNPPAAATFVELWLYQARDGLTFNGEYASYLAAATVEHLFQVWPLSFFDTHTLGVTVQYGSTTSVFLNAPSNLSESYLFKGAAPADTVSADLSEELLPRLAGVVPTAPDGPARPVVSWLTDGPPEGDGGAFVISFGGNLPLGEGRGTWTFVTPNVAEGSLQAPVLPDGLLPLAPRADEAPAVPTSGTLFEASWIDYQGTITSGFDTVGSIRIGAVGAPIGDSLYRASTWGSQGGRPPR